MPGGKRPNSTPVHAHRNGLIAKLDIHKQADLVRDVIREGLVRH